MSSTTPHHYSWLELNTGLYFEGTQLKSSNEPLGYVTGGKVLLYDTQLGDFTNTYSFDTDVPVGIHIDPQDDTRVYVLCNQGTDATGVLHIVQRNGDALQLQGRSVLTFSDPVAQCDFHVLVGGGIGFTVSHDGGSLYFCNWSSDPDNFYRYKMPVSSCNLFNMISKWNLSADGLSVYMDKYFELFGPPGPICYLPSGITKASHDELGGDILYISAAFACTDANGVAEGGRSPGVQIITSAEFAAHDPNSNASIGRVVGADTCYGDSNSMAQRVGTISGKIHFR